MPNIDTPQKDGGDPRKKAGADLLRTVRDTNLRAAMDAKDDSKRSKILHDAMDANQFANDADLESKGE